MCMYPQSVPSWSKDTMKALMGNGKLIYNGWKKNPNELMTVPCGKCPDCRKLRAMQWSFRLLEETKRSKSAYFITLTYDDDNLPLLHGEKTLCKKDGQDFIKKLRRSNEYAYKQKQDFRKYGKKADEHKKAFENMEGEKIKYFFIGEYGGQTDRPHYHAIMFNINKPTIDKLPKIWGKGQVKVGTVTEKSIRYVSNYVMATQEDKNKRQPEYANMSKGLGLDYILKNESYHRKKLEPLVKYNDSQIPMPKYYRDKVYNEEERHYQGDKARENHLIRTEELKKQLQEQGIDYDQYIRDKNWERWNNFTKHKKYKRNKIKQDGNIQ